MSEPYSLIAVSREGDTGVIELARPKAFNCLSVEAFGEIERALRSFEADANTRALLIRAQGKHFCTGADLGQVKARRASRDAMEDFLRLGHEVLCAIEASRLISIAAVQGLCLAGGLELMLACDVVFAEKTAQFGDQHGQFGLAPGWGGSQRLPRTIGLRRAMDLFVSVRWIDTDTALAWGLVNYVCEEGALVRDPLEYCAKLATRSRSGLALMKSLARRGLELPLAEGLALERQDVVDPLLSLQVGEGIAAFEEKRKPAFP